MFLKNLLRSEERFLILLCLIVGLLVLVPILNRFITARIFLDLFLTAIVIKMVYAVSDKKGQIIAGLLMAAIMLASLWSQYIYPNKPIEAIGMIVGVLFTFGVITNLLGFVHKSAGINRETIYAAILLYLLAALMWSFLYTLFRTCRSCSVQYRSGSIRESFIGISVLQFCYNHHAGLR